uniref:F-box domain-containing protein n=1 Tax=Minutocellus polymorphus TaxID=265543 RepID=A0A7S0FJU1_9STRA|mmetsp:Transcript_1359/g.2292  ORF Transcript_1359/g.2292 Transcript_1359/m.2292 type:complete len:371 (+) Transcript_1359:148-1260(+)|eukprot:CAMPEP_0197726748 /NCGR_PEP_ID=MMETSP1434-20131217/17031_1 /TAXON_ID=265543 /ORGANISM="Minutocellus polymorphus, Strain CCMP3303" /LENGTH=370 /DNA_ID=CAMNT_0043312769 /DNA_START=148 /DNA_END=1260 /DNA_ORIENTATION=-
MSSSPPAAKRSRLGEAKTAPTTVGTADRTKSGDQETADGTPRLSADIWVEVVDYLYFDDMMRVCAVSRMFLMEVVPRIEKVSVEGNRRHLFPAFASRLGSIKGLHVFDLFSVQIRVGEAVQFNQRHLMQLLTFLAKLPLVESIILFGRKQLVEGENEWTRIKLFQHEPAGLIHFFLSDRESEKLRAFVDAVCGLALSRSLARTVDIPWLLDHSICTKDIDGYDSDCKYCRTVCSSFRFRSILYSLAGRRCRSRENAICLQPCYALEILKDRHDHSGGALAECIDKRLLLYAIENERLDFIKALIDLNMLPKVNRGDINSHGFGFLRGVEKPRIYTGFYDLLISKGVPLRTSDFSNIFSEEDEFDECEAYI